MSTVAALVVRMARKGYDEEFLGTRVPLPTLSAALDAEVLRNASFRDSIWTPYINYSVATNSERRQPIVTAL